jgi:hypothetical protein
VTVNRRTSQAIGLALALCWFVSLFLPAAHFAGAPPFPGYRVLTNGWLAIMVFQLAWWANPLFLIVMWQLVVAKRSRPLLLRAGAIFLFLLGASATRWSGLPDTFGPERMTAWGAGFYFWMLAVWGGGMAAVVRAGEQYGSKRE